MGGGGPSFDKARVLIVTTDADRGAAIARAVSLLGLRVVVVDALGLAGAPSQALVIVDRPSGWAAMAKSCRRLRAQLPMNPILVVTRDCDSLTRAMLLESGANQVLGEPFCGRELLACVWALIRDVPEQCEPVTALRVIARSLKLTPSQRLLLDELCRARGDVVEVPQLLEAAFKGRHYSPDSSNLRVHMCRLRAKLLPAGFTVQGLSGRGYRVLSNAR
jgi:DNA-binding response OmpR family regulator